MRIYLLIPLKMLIPLWIFTLRGENPEFNSNHSCSLGEIVSPGFINSIPGATTIAFLRE